MRRAIVMIRATIAWLIVNALACSAGPARSTDPVGPTARAEPVPSATAHAEAMTDAPPQADDVARPRPRQDGSMDGGPPVQDEGDGQAARSAEGEHEPGSMPRALAGRSPEQMLEWARENVEGLAALREPSSPDFGRLARGQPTVSLFVPESILAQEGDAHQSRCRRVTFAVASGVLSAEVPFPRGDGVPALTTPGRFQEISVGNTVSVYGVHERWIRSNERGEREVVVEASPLVGSPARTLFEITADEIRYGAVPVRAQIQCALVESRPCLADDGTASEASRCTKLQVIRHSLRAGVRFGRPGLALLRLGTPVGKTLPACSSGPEDELGGSIEPLNRLLAGRALLAPAGMPWPVLSRSRGPCERAERAESPP